MKKLFVAIMVLMAVVFGFTACLNKGSGNQFNYGLASPALVGYNLQTGQIVLNTAYGIFVPDNASALKLISIPSGDCIYMAFDYNSDYQTDTKYAVASNIEYQPVSVNYIQGINPEYVSEYSYPFSIVELFDTSLSPLYKGKFFVGTKAKLDTNQSLIYYTYSDKQPDSEGVTTIFMQAKLPGTSSGANEVISVRGLEMGEMLSSIGRDTTIVENGTSYSSRYMKVNLKYCSEFKNEAPVFKSVSDKPFYIYILKEDL